MTGEVYTEDDLTDKQKEGLRHLRESILNQTTPIQDNVTKPVMWLWIYEIFHNFDKKNHTG
jgi:hypothetical protein